MRRSISAQSWDSVPPAPGVDGDKAGIAVMGAGEHALEFGRLDLLYQAVVHLRHFGQRLCILGFLAQLDHHADILQPGGSAVPHLDDLFQGGAFS